MADRIYTYEDNNITYNVKAHSKLVTGTRFGVENNYSISGSGGVVISYATGNFYQVSGALDFIKNKLYNAVDIDWNDATITLNSGNVNINSTSDLLLLIEELEQRISALENT